MFSQRQRLNSQTDLENSCFTPLQANFQQRKSALMLNHMKENINSNNIFRSPKNGLIPYQYQQKIQLQSKPKAMTQIVKSPNINNNYKVVTLPFHESKENEIMNRPLPSYMDRHLAQAVSKQMMKEEGAQSSRNISSPHYQQNLAPLSPNVQQQFKISPIPQSVSTKTLKERSSFLLKTPQNGIKLPNNIEQIKGKTANGFFTQKLKIKNSSNYLNNYLIPTNDEAQKVPSCPILYDDNETDRSPLPETLTPNNKRTTCRRTKFIFKKYMDENEETSQKSPELLTANISKKLAQMNTESTSAEKENINTNNSFEKSEDFSQLKKYYGLKYEPKLSVQQERKPIGNIKSKRLQMILKQRDGNIVALNNFTTNDLICEYDMKPWENKNETFVNEQMDTSLQEILNQLS